MVTKVKGKHSEVNRTLEYNTSGGYFMLINRNGHKK